MAGSPRAVANDDSLMLPAVADYTAGGHSNPRFG